MKGNDKMKKIIINHIVKKYNLIDNFKKRLMKKDINIIDIFKIWYIINKKLKNI